MADSSPKTATKAGSNAGSNAVKTTPKPAVKAVPKAMPKKTDASGALSALFKIDKGQIVNAPDTSAVWIERERLEPNPDQPRKRFDAQSIAELGDDLKINGQLQALVVRPHPDAGTIGAKQNVFQIVAGERRWRAAAAQFGDLPRLRCIIRDLNDAEALAISLSENEKRSDITVIEFARGLKRLKESAPGGTWDSVLSMVAIKRTHLFRVMGLLDLPEAIQARIDEGELNEKHGRALLEFPAESEAQNALLQAIDMEDLSGNAAMERAKKMREDAAQPKVSPGGLLESAANSAIGQATGSAFEQAGPTPGFAPGPMKESPTGWTAGDSSSRSYVSGAAQISQPRDIIASFLKPATSYVSEVRRRVAQDNLSDDYKRKLKAELSLLESHIISLKEELT